MLHEVPCLSSTLAERLSICDGYIRLMLDVRYDAADHIMTKRKEQRIRCRDWLEGKSRPFCTKYSMVRCIQCFTLYHELNFVLLTWLI